MAHWVKQDTDDKTKNTKTIHVTDHLLPRRYILVQLTVQQRREEGGSGGGRGTEEEQNKTKSKKEVHKGEEPGGSLEQEKPDTGVGQ